MRIYYRNGAWQIRTALVVIRDNNVNTDRSSVFDLLVGCNSGVDRYNERRARVSDCGNCRNRYAVSFAVTVGDVVIYPRTERLQIEVERSDGGYSVHVVVSVDSNKLVGFHSAIDAVYRRVYAEHIEGIA